MKLAGSCHCGAVSFTLSSNTAVPYMHCYCSICRKTAGGGGFAINLGGDATTLEVTGEEHLSVYQAKTQSHGEPSPARRHFCKHCGSALWVFDPRWPELIHPFASAIDSPLTSAPERAHIMMNYKPAWVPAPEGPEDRWFDEYPDQSLADWHQAQGLDS